MDKRPQNTLARFLIALLAGLIVLALATLVFVVVRYAGGPASQPAPAPAAETAVPENAPTPIPTPTAVPEPTPVPSAETVDLPETADMGQEYQDKLVFLGDSTTYGMGAYSVLPFSQIWVPANGTLALFNWAIETIDYFDPAAPDSSQPLSISDCALVRQPEILVITLGVNGVSFLDEASFKQYYGDLIGAILAVSPNTKIICQSMYPVIDAKATGYGITNAKINAANVWIRDVAAANGARYLNTHDLLMDGSGDLNAAYSNGDDMGIHLNPDGFAVVLQNLRTHPYQ